MGQNRCLLLSLCLMVMTSVCFVRGADDNTLEAVVSRLAQDVTELRAKVLVLEAAAGRKAAFHARHPPNPIVPNVPIRFVVDRQVGEGYDPTTGIYTVPFSGWYTVHSRLYLQNAVDFHLDVHQNNAIVSRFHCYSAVASTCPSDALLHVSSGDRLSIQAQNFHGTLFDLDFDNVFSLVLDLPD